MNDSCKVKEWAKKLGIKKTTLHMRLFAYGWTAEQALTRKRG